jgi:hypothetical protein
MNILVFRFSHVCTSNDDVLNAYTTSEKLVLMFRKKFLPPSGAWRQTFSTKLRIELSLHGVRTRIIIIFRTSFLHDYLCACREISASITGFKKAT